MGTPDWEELGRQLEAARGLRKANEVGRALGISGKQVRNYERAIATSGRPQPARILALANLYGVSPEPWLALAGFESKTVMRVTVDTGDGAMHMTVLDPDNEGPDLLTVSDRALLDELERRLQARASAAAGEPPLKVIPLSPATGRPSLYDTEKRVADGSEREPGEFERDD